MRIYQSSITAASLRLLKKLKPDIKIHVLRSYLVDGPGTFEILSTNPGNIKSLALDSGTFSITENTHKHHIDVLNYADFLEDCSSFYNFYFGFDPEHGDEGTESSIENQRILEAKGFTPIPVIQNLQLEVDYYTSQASKYPFVAIGSTRKKNIDDLVKATNILHSANIKVHWFGIGSFAKLTKAPVWSSDCSSFAQWIKNGRLIYFDEVNGKEVSFATREYSKNGEPNKDYVRLHPLCEDYEEWLHGRLGLSLEDVIHHGDMKLAVNSYYFYELEQKLTKEQMAKGYIYDCE
ncbi:hypothetical protein [Solidesulfovibrio magneticus]|uniref:Queuine tRNA-ribosyltransferase n=1 Tax=Solidesulfovibrio magneticus (strain ATCC 700980 / DSM 13731 / RS-1) TaxID=573370 RepID=C4XTR2_SOLM1|nr:hypothetical protein [Solidesulfovibrio magneticus]BAH73577.1 hypothetical protein DMR_00860 [Solidesulfovibrio magneticus RS-1]